MSFAGRYPRRSLTRAGASEPRPGLRLVRADGNQHFGLGCRCGSRGSAIVVRTSSAAVDGIEALYPPYPVDAVEDEGGAYLGLGAPPITDRANDTRTRASFGSLPRRHGGREGEGGAADFAAMAIGEGFGISETGAAFPMLQQLVEAEAGGAQCRRSVPGERGREGEDHRLLAIVFELGLAGKGTAAESGPAGNLLRIAETVAQRQQGAIEGVAVQIEEPGLVDETAGLDQAAGPDLAFGVLQLGFLFGKASFVLFMGADALGQRAGHRYPPGYVIPWQQGRAGMLRQQGDSQGYHP
jgi:hypothetical protein